MPKSKCCHREVERAECAISCPDAKGHKRRRARWLAGSGILAVGYALALVAAPSTEDGYWLAVPLVGPLKGTMDDYGQGWALLAATQLTGAALILIGVVVKREVWGRKETSARVGVVPLANRGQGLVIAGSFR